MFVVPDKATSIKPVSPSRFTGLCQPQRNRIIAAHNPVWTTDMPAPGGDLLRANPVTATCCEALPIFDLPGPEMHVAGGIRKPR